MTNTSPAPVVSPTTVESSDDIEPGDNVDVMTATPATVTRGEEFEIAYSGPLETTRGAFFYLVDATGQRRAGLWSNRIDGVDEPGYTLDPERMAILDVGVIEPGPDVLVAPPEIAPGRYLVCTANSQPQGCAEIELTAG